MVSINPVTGLYSGAASQLQKNAVRIQNTIASLVSGNRITQASQGVAELAITTQLQGQVSALRQTAGNINQAYSLTQVAEGGIARQQEIVDRLRQLATQANSGVLDDSAREGLNIEFQNLVGELNRIAGGTAFNGTKLLDGSYNLSFEQALGQEDDGEGASLSIDDLSADALFDGESLDILSQENAQAALSVLENAGNSLAGTRAEVGSFSQSLDLAAVSVDSALFNQEAARSALSDADFAETATQLALLNLQRNAGLALQAQTNKLPPNVLDLLNGSA